MLRFLVLAVLIMLCASGQSAQAAAAEDGLLQATGQLRLYQVSPDGLFFRLQGSSLRFGAEYANFKGPPPLREVAEDAHRTEAVVTVRYRADRFYTMKSGAVVFEVLSLTTAKATFNTSQGFEPPRRPPSGGFGMKDVALALILLDDGSPTDAKAHLDAALGHDLPIPPRAFALDTRARLLLTLGQARMRGPAQDELFAQGVKDIIEWRTITKAPDAGAVTLAPLLRELGAYDEALALYRKTLNAHPDSTISPIGLAQTYRALGKPAEALATIDEARASGKLIAGMPASYHRAWALIELKRYAEAIQSLDEGLAFQPDYGWAHLYRGCALAALGRLPEAALAAKRGADLLAALPLDKDTAEAETAENARAAEMASSLEQLARSAPTSPSEAACGLFPGPEAPRPRSPLLPPPQAW